LRIFSRYNVAELSSWLDIPVFSDYRNIIAVGRLRIRYETIGDTALRSSQLAEKSEKVYVKLAIRDDMHAINA